MLDVSEKYGFKLLNIQEISADNQACYIKIVDVLDQASLNVDAIKTLLHFTIKKQEQQFGCGVSLHSLGDHEGKELLVRCKLVHCLICKEGLNPFEKVYFYGLYKRNQIVYFSTSRYVADTAKAQLLVFKNENPDLCADLSKFNNDAIYAFRCEIENNKYRKVMVEDILIDTTKAQSKELKLRINNLPMLSRLLYEKYPLDWPDSVYEILRNKSLIRDLRDDKH